jgi:DNA-binding CsgD family transcriptional regulator
MAGATGLSAEGREAIGSRRGAGAPLSGREREILGMLAGGASGAVIAEQLVLSPETVRTHIRNAMAKLEASSRAQAVALAVQRQEIDWPSAAGDDEQPTALGPASAPSTASGRARARSSVLAAGNADATLTALLAGLVSLYDVDGGTIFLTEEDGLSLRRAAVLGDRDQSDNGQLPERVQLGEGALGRAALERRVQLVHGSGSPELAHGRATICAPMIAFGRLVGVICLTTRPSRLVGRGELLLLQAFANRVGEVLLSAGGDQRSRLRVSLERFRASWSSPSR